MAKKLLDDERIVYKERDLGHRLDTKGYQVYKFFRLKYFQEYINGLVYVTRQTTVPQIFICGQFIGGELLKYFLVIFLGYTELKRLKDAEKLLKAIDICAYKFEEVV